MDLVQYKSDAIGLRNKVNETIIEGEQYFNSFLRLSELLQESKAKEKDNPIIIIQIENQQIAIKLKMSNFIGDKTNEFIKLTETHTRNINKVSEIIDKKAGNINTLVSLMREHNSKATHSKEEIYAFTNANVEANEIKDFFEKNEKLIDEINSDGNEYNSELKRCEAYLIDLNTKFINLLTTN